MPRCCRFAFVLIVAASTVTADDWRQFRGPNGLGVSDEKNLPFGWSEDGNIAWKVKLPGAGASCPITVGNRIFVTCYSGYGMDTKTPGDQKDLKRHLVCLDRKGKIMWSKDFDPELPEHNYQGEGAYHGYAANTPITDGQRLYVFFGKSGVYCFDLNGKEIWRQSVGKGTNGWGSGVSPILYKNLVIINASIESGSMIALDKNTGKEVWKAVKIGGNAFNTPMAIAKMEFADWCKGNGFDPDKLSEQQTATLKQLHADVPVELVVSLPNRVVAFDPDSGRELWFADGVKSYTCSSVVAHKGVVYVIGGGSFSAAIRTGGRGNVTATHVLWKQNKGSNASSPIVHDGYLYWASEGGGVIHCQDLATGKEGFTQRLAPDAGRIWASPVLADGKLYFVSQSKGVFVVAAQPKFQLVAHNKFADDQSRSNASIAVSDGQLLLRNDQYLYCIGKQ